MASAAKKTKTKLPEELLELEKIVGEFMLYWGFKNIHGRIWAHLYTSHDPLDSLELMARLKVSKGLMSLAIRDLLQYEVISANHTGKHGTTFYHANPDLFGVITNVLKQRENKMLLAAKTAAVALQGLKSAERSAAGLDDEKLAELVEFTESAQGLLAAFLMPELDDLEAAVLQ